MKFKVTKSKKFSLEFKNFPEQQQNKILDFILNFKQNGLKNFSFYEGKISHSWKNLEENSDKYKYAKNNKLWHYHIGIPEYIQNHLKFKTSDVVLHFQWKDEYTIKLVDIYDHYDSKGIFYLPKKKNLK
jgi:mRNA-degrading endonuclease RelE of RelBE toxin-antitoxin system